MKAIVWVERTNCNNKCPYCIVYHKDIPQAPVTWQDWVAKINFLNPAVLDITGGEPFLNPNMVDIIKTLNPGINLGITTNCTQDLTRFINEIPSRRILSMTLSYHPSQIFSKEAFLGKALMLKNRGYPINVNFVAYPEQLWLIPELKNYFEVLHGVRFHVDPYSINPLFPYTLNQSEIDFLKQYAGKDREYRFKEAGSNKVKCSAGHDYLLLQPNGDVFRCMTLVWKDAGSIGNIFDPNFKIHETPQLCENFISCAGCDMDKVTVEVVND